MINDVANDPEISLPEDINQAVSLNSWVNICKAFRDTVKGPLALLSYKIQDIENTQPNDGELLGQTDEFDTVDGYS